MFKFLEFTNEMKILNFYLVALYLHAVILNLFSRFDFIYKIGKEFALKCNLENQIKYKFVAYKLLARASIELK